MGEIRVHLDRSEVTAGEVVTGTVTDDGQPVEMRVALRRVAGLKRGRIMGSDEVEARSDPVTGRFALPVAATADPSFEAERVQLRWAVAAKTTVRGQRASTPLVIENPIRPVPVELQRSIGHDPPHTPTFSGEHWGTILPAFIFVPVCVGMAIFLLVGDGPLSLGGRFDPAGFGPS